MSVGPSASAQAAAQTRIVNGKGRFLIPGLWAGKLADMVLLEANPLVDIGNTRSIQAVVFNGRFFDRTGLDALAR